MDPLAKARAIRSMVAEYKRKHKGATDTAARSALGIPAPDTPALHAWTPPERFLKGDHMATTKNGGEKVVCDDSGVGVTTKSGARIHANYGGHVKVEFDGPALGASLQGFLNQLQYGNSMNAVAIFPGMYPEQAKYLQAQKQFCSEREIGVEMAKLLGTGIRVFNISPEQWGRFYVEALANAAPLPRQIVGNGAVAGQLTNGAADGDGFGSPLDAPSVETDEFGAGR